MRLQVCNAHGCRSMCIYVTTLLYLLDVRRMPQGAQILQMRHRRIPAMALYTDNITTHTCIPYITTSI